MAGSSASDILFISVNHSITLIGKVWLIVMIFLRLLILVFAGYPLYQDEQERFVCNTIQPGCANVCYDLFAPVSLFRFWLVQLVTLCLPYAVFVVYVVHKASGALTADLDARALRALRRVPFGGKAADGALPRVGEAGPGPARCFAGAYILQLVFRTLLEAGFGAAHYYLFGFYVSRRFLCQSAPCTTQVDCYISRPTEKTVMLNFMLGVASLSLLLDVVDFICAIKRSVRQKSRRRLMVEKVFEVELEEEEECFITVGGASGRTEPNHAQLEAPRGRAASFRKRQGSRSSGAGLDLGPEPPLVERGSLPRSLGGPSCNTNGNNGCAASQSGSLEREGSEVALCPQDLTGTPRPIRVSKRSLLKPPPPPRRNPVPPSGGPSCRDIATTTAVSTRRVGQYTLVELGSAELQGGDDGQEKRSEWV